MIYLDNAATTAPDWDALAFAEAFNKKFFNPSALYSGGIEVSSFLGEAREVITSAIAPSGYECVFTSCGTESDNLAVFCSGKRGIYVTDKGEHSAIYKSFLELERRKINTHFIGLNKDGSVNAEELF